MGSSGHQQLRLVLQQPSGNKAGHACTWSRHEYEEGYQHHNLNEVAGGTGRTGDWCGDPN